MGDRKRPACRQSEPIRRIAGFRNVLLTGRKRIRPCIENRVSNRVISVALELTPASTVDAIAELKIAIRLTALAAATATTASAPETPAATTAPAASATTACGKCGRWSVASFIECCRSRNNAAKRIACRPSARTRESAGASESNKVARLRQHALAQTAVHQERLIGAGAVGRPDRTRRIAFRNRRIAILQKAQILESRIRSRSRGALWWSCASLAAASPWGKAAPAKAATARTTAIRALPETRSLRCC